jgi:ectoine hydroxylase
MKLTPAQIEQFNQDGYLFFPSLFTSEETKTLTEAVPELYQRREVYNVREKDSDAVRTNFAAHLYSNPFARLACHPRMIRPVEQIFNEKLYMHQFKINGKMAFEGDVWQWHQDYGTWLNDDLMPEPRAMNIAIFLDDVHEFNGPLMLIPGSHKKGVIDASHDLTTTSYPLWTISNELISQLVNRAGGKNGGIVSPKGPAAIVNHDRLSELFAEALSNDTPHDIGRSTWRKGDDQRYRPIWIALRHRLNTENSQEKRTQ